MAKSNALSFDMVQDIRTSAANEVAGELAYLEAVESSDAKMAEWLGAIGHEAGKPATGDQVADWAAIADAWTDHYSELRNVDKLAAGRAWQRMVNRIGAAKPQTAEAIKKAAVRAAKKAADDANPAGKPVEVAAPTSGKAAAEIVLETLSAMEKHLIAMCRAGQFAKAATLVNEMSKAS